MRARFSPLSKDHSQHPPANCEDSISSKKVSRRTIAFCALASAASLRSAASEEKD